MQGLSITEVPELHGNINARFLNEAKEFAARWENNKFDRFERAITAKMMECQRLHNETGTWDCCDECKEISNKAAES